MLVLLLLLLLTLWWLQGLWSSGLKSRHGPVNHLLVEHFY